MNIEHLEIPDRAVIIIRGWEDSLDGDDFIQELLKEYPTSLVVSLSDDITMETMDIDMLEGILRDLIAHKEALP